jgi:hypothetical protein
MAGKSIELFGTIVHVFGPGGETTGYVIQLPPLDVDLHKHVVTAGEKTVAGEFVERHWPLRGTVRVLRVTEIADAPSHLSRAGMAASVILSGTIRTGVIKPGGETTGAELVGASPDVDLSKLDNVKIENPDGKQCAVTGHFVGRQWPLRKLVFQFDAKALRQTTSPPTYGFPDVKDDLRVTATGYSDQFSLEEAVTNAIAQLPPTHIADWLWDVSVDKIGAEVGGIAGFHRMKVQISAPKPPGKA